eukprot:TRINITY_DN6734_c0_g1_i2.p1 TRINITY_DN6734_c0_g1~~TRINITY_DN6734_c0_g1_i2.p1  ORF type:complete len:499 (-),score=61.55 TRINITY_DN6734_c0_g1_i2:150-1646(-)
MVPPTIRGLPAAPKGAVDNAALNKFEAAMRKRVDKKLLPGYCSCVIIAGEVAHVSQYGYADMERGVPFTPETIVRVYCQTKTVIACGILILMERGLLKLTDPVGKFIPAFKRLRRVGSGTAISKSAPFSPSVPAQFTILRLLTHTAGLGYGNDFGTELTDGHSKMYKPLLDAIDRYEIPNLEEYCDELAKLPLRFKPGESLRYSMGHDICGRIIEVLSGKPLDEFCKTEIFEPLGMCDTGFFVPRKKASRLAALYGNRERAERMAKKFGDYVTNPKPLPRGKSALCRIDGNEPSQSNYVQGRQSKVFAGNGILGSNMGGLVSTLRDQALFFTMLLNGGVVNGVRILQTSTLEEWGFKNLLALPGALGKVRRTGGGWSGWSVLGERGMKRWKRDAKPNTDDYEDGEIAMGGCANTFWSVNPERDQVSLWFSQTLDSDAWGLDRVSAAGVTRSSPDNMTVMARSIAPRNGLAAALRRKRLSANDAEKSSTKRRRFAVSHA